MRCKAYYLHGEETGPVGPPGGACARAARWDASYRAARSGGVAVTTDDARLDAEVVARASAADYAAAGP